MLQSVSLNCGLSRGSVLSQREFPCMGLCQKGVCTLQAYGGLQPHGLMLLWGL